MSDISQIIIKSFFKGIGQASGISIAIIVGWQIKNTFYHFYPLFSSSKKQINIIETDHEEINDEDVKDTKDKTKSKIIRKLFDKL
jgi:hypothetical protein